MDCEIEGEITMIVNVESKEIELHQETIKATKVNEGDFE